MDSEMSLEARRGRAVDARHQALIDFASAVMKTRGFVTNDQLNAFRGAGYDDKAVIEVIAAISAHTFTNLYNHVHATDVDFPIPPTA